MTGPGPGNLIDMTYQNQGADQPGRVVVGVDLTLSGLHALRLAVAEARYRRVGLHAIRALGPSPVESSGQASSTVGLAGQLGLGAVAGTGEAPPSPRQGALAAEAEALVAQAFVETLGAEPGDVRVQVAVPPDHPGRALVEYACREGDLLVIGRGERHRLRRPRGSQIVRYCLRHAGCPVLVVPPPPLTRAGSPRSLLRQLRRDLDELTGHSPE